MNRSLLNLLLGLIKSEGQSLDPVRNLLGAPVSNLGNPFATNATQYWKIYSLPGVFNSTPLSPDEIVNNLSTLQSVSSPVLGAIEGILSFQTQPGTILGTTIINVPHALSVRLEVDAPGAQIAIYAHETLVTRGTNSLTTFINISAGKTVINVVTQNTNASTVTFNLPPDINSDFTAFLPPQPTWLASGTINPGYLDPTTGHPGVQIFWNNQTNVAGWDLYRVNQTQFGTITQWATINGNYAVATTFSGTGPNLPLPGSIAIVSGTIYVGTILSAVYSTDYNLTNFVIKPFDNGDSVFSGIAFGTLTFSTLAVIYRNANNPIIDYIDEKVQVGTTYSYTIDSISLIDPFIKSDKISIQTVTTPNIPFIGTATLTEQSPGYLTLALSDIGTQVRYWSGWIRKNNWPTVLSGSAFAQLNNDYLKFYDEDIAQTTFTFSATNGFWYGEVVAYDANNNSSTRTLCSGQVSGIGVNSGVPTLTFIGIDLVTNQVGVQFNKLWWTTNTAAEKPTLGSGYQVQIFASNITENVSNVNITTPNPRFVWQDYEDTNSNFNDTTNSLLLYGSMLDPFASIQNPSDLAKLNRVPKYSVWYYTIKLLSNDGSSTIGTYHTQIGGPYSSSSSGGSGGVGGGGFPPKQ